MLELLERAGVVTQRGARYEPTRIGERRSGGTVELTAFGVVTVVEHVRSAGVTVETIDSPESLTAQDLADLADNQTVDVDVWWDALVRWRAGQGDPRHALAAVFDSMGPATVLSVLTDEMPDGLADDVAFVLRDAFDTRGPDDPVAVAALWWLFDHGLLDLEEVSPHTVEMSRLALIGLVVEAEPESVDKHWGAGQSRPELLAEVAEIARLMPANVEALLEAIGRHYPDAIVSKSARRELLKVRSGLAGQRQG
jgi:hypothetical protein